MTRELYFRVKDGGAQVFRVVTDTKDGRLELDPLAHISLKTGDWRVQGNRALSTSEDDQIRTWIQRRRAELDRRAVEDVKRTIEDMQSIAHWVQNKAPDDALASIEDDLIMATHDLRMAVVKRMAAR